LNGRKIEPVEEQEPTTVVARCGCWRALEEIQRLNTERELQNDFLQEERERNFQPSAAQEGPSGQRAIFREYDFTNPKISPS